MEGFRYVIKPEVRYRDIDAMGHVNNAVYATYFEHARTSYYRDVVGQDPADLSFMLAHIEIDFRSSVTFGDDVRVGARMASIGDKSMTTEYIVESSGETAAEGETVQVVIDDEGVPCPVPDEWRYEILEYEGKENVEDAES